MNAKPHTHEVAVGRQWHNGTGCYVIRYGDTTLHVASNGLFRTLRLRLGTRRVINRHDRQSRKAGRRAQTDVAAQGVVSAASKGASRWQ